MFLIKKKISIQFKPSVTVNPSKVKLDLYGAGSEMVWRHVAWNGIFSIFTLVFGRDEVKSFCNFGRGRISTWGAAAEVFASSDSSLSSVSSADLVSPFLLLSNSFSWSCDFSVSQSSLIWTGFRIGILSLPEDFFPDLLGGALVSFWPSHWSTKSSVTRNSSCVTPQTKWVSELHSWFTPFRTMWFVVADCNEDEHLSAYIQTRHSTKHIQHRWLNKNSTHWHWEVQYYD